MFFKQLLQSSSIRLLLIALVLCGIALTGSRSTGQASAARLQAATSLQAGQNTVSASETAPNAVSDIVLVSCTAHNVAATSTHVSIHSVDCSPSTGSILYFITPADSRKANQVLAIALSAQARGKRINIFYDPNDTTDVPDVAVQRKIASIGVDQ